MFVHKANPLFTVEMENRPDASDRSVGVKSNVGEEKTTAEPGETELLSLIGFFNLECKNNIVAIKGDIEDYKEDCGLSCQFFCVDIFMFQ